MRNGNAAVLLLPVSEVDDLVEEEGPAGGAGEPRGDELVPVGQEGVAPRARKEPLPADVLNETGYRTVGSFDVDSFIQVN